MNSKQKRWITGISVFVLILIKLKILGYLFPFTGFVAIVLIPFIVVVDIAMILITIRYTKNTSKLIYALTWIVLSVLIFFFTLIFYPQESRPLVIEQIGYSISAIKNYDNSTIDDLNLPFKVENFERYDCPVKDAHERYVVSLFKFRNQIPLDSSFYLYREDKQNIITSDYEPRITSINEIPVKLRTGQDKMIWWILNKLKK
jgi:hypothetical protein